MNIEKGQPAAIGRYVVYFGEQVSLLKWTGKQWEYAVMGGNFPFTVKGWIGPLPEYGAPAPMEYDL